MGDANLLITFVDKDGHEWYAAAFMGPLRLTHSETWCEVKDLEAQMPDLKVKEFKVVMGDGG